MGLDTKSNATLWKDYAMVELNYAVMYSYQVKLFHARNVTVKVNKELNSKLPNLQTNLVNFDFKAE